MKPIADAKKGEEHQNQAVGLNDEEVEENRRKQDGREPRYSQEVIVPSGTGPSNERPERL